MPAGAGQRIGPPPKAAGSIPRSAGEAHDGWQQVARAHFWTARAGSH